ncbi:MAG: hypothetical protein HYX40_09995 [Sphingobacteriales bacterium]|nr:hypothetical protein [Sphingobacteriales bacterium]
MNLKVIFFFLCCSLTAAKINAQQKNVLPDTSVNHKSDKVEKTDSVVKKQPHSPRKATIRSAIIPGWGQIYNKKYWKVPLVYGALGTTAGIFAYNIKWYNRTRYAYKIAYQIQQGGGSAGQETVYKDLVPLLDKPEALKQYRNEFRQNVDYSVLIFLLAWGLNVVDATVDGHLKDFDVSEDLTLRINPGYSPMANTTGLSFIVSIGKNKSSKNLTSLR